MNAIIAQNLGKRLGGDWVLEGLSFEVAPGEVFGLLGPNGAGKTTALRLLAGLYAPDVGRGTVAGFPITPGRAGGSALRGKVGLLTEQPGFYDRLPARYNLIYFGRLYGLNRHEAEKRADALIDRLALRSHAAKPFAALSRGMKQKLAIARAVLHKPAVVLLDEPTVALDPEATREVRALVQELAHDKTAVVLCTHQLVEVERLCARAAILARRLVGIHEVNAGSALQRVRVGVEALSPEVIELAGKLHGVASVSSDDGTLDVRLDRSDRVPELVAALAHHGVRMTSVIPARTALEEAYLAMLGQAREQGWLV